MFINTPIYYILIKDCFMFKLEYNENLLSGIYF